MANKEDDFRRIDSISRGVYGFDFSQRKEIKAIEIDPGKLNLDELDSFLKFLGALNNTESRSIAFLRKIPEARLSELKKKYEFLGALLAVLDRF